MILTIHQPEFLPWLGFFERIYRADTFIILDDVGYQKNGFMNRNRIKTANGWQWLTIPVMGRSPNKKINQVLIDNKEDWEIGLWNALSKNYSSAPFFNNYSDFFQDTLERKWDLIADLDVYLIEKVIKMFGLTRIIEKSSNLRVEGMATERLVNICKQFKADTYLSGPGGKNYMDISLFEQAGIKVIFQEFKQLEYQQQFIENGFLTGLSVIDALFNNGPKSLDIILNDKK